MSIKHLKYDKIMVVAAVKFAIEKHGLQADKGGEPYIFHPLAVMLNPGIKTDEERIVAVLHDVLEDTPTSVYELNARFPQGIIAAVVALTRSKSETYKEYLVRVKRNQLATKIKIADIAHNLSIDRMSALPKPEREGLSKRYKSALDFLLGE